MTIFSKMVNILAPSPYVIILMVHRVQQPARPLSLPAPNIHHKAQYYPGLNISATKNIHVLQDTTDPDKPFPISSANSTAPAMKASIRGTFASCSRIVLHVIFRFMIAHPLQIPSYRLCTTPVVGTMDTVSLTCKDASAFSWRIHMIIMHPSFPSTRTMICTSFLVWHICPLVLISLI
jgi:hypothetical protein